MTDKETVYECHNTACTLGTPGNPGRFTGGATKEQITTLTGNPEPENFGDGVCPNCGTLAAKKTTDSVPHKGRDPYKRFHEQIEARVLDPEDKLNVDNAQAALYELVEGEVDDAHS